MKPHKEMNDYVKIAKVLGGILFVIILMFLIFAKEMITSVIGTIIWGFVVLGIVLAFFLYKSQKK